MKSLFVTLLIVGAAFLAYDYFGAAPGEKIVFKSLNTVAPSPTDLPAPVVEKPKAPEEAPKPAASTSVATAPTTGPVAPTSTTPIETKPTFVEPKFASLADLSKGWTVIPKSAFPRPVKLTKNTQFKMAAGVSTMNAGTPVVALGFENGLLTLAPNAASAIRGTAPVDDTNLKEVIEEGYGEWKTDRIAAAKRAFEGKQARAAAPVAAADPLQVGAGGKPVRGSDGSFPVLVSSLKSGDVTELKLANIHHWDDPVPTMVDGKPAWSIKVQADVETVFGLQPAEAQALVRDGRVKGWFYTGSGEAVP